MEKYFNFIKSFIRSFQSAFVHFSGVDQRANKVFPQQIEPHLLQDVLGLLLLGQRAVGLHVHVLDDLTRGADISVRFEYKGEHQVQPRAFALKIHFPVADILQCPNELHPHGLCRRLLDVGQALLHDCGDGELALVPALIYDRYGGVQLDPVILFAAQASHVNTQLLQRVRVVVSAALLLQAEKSRDRLVQALGVADEHGLGNEGLQKLGSTRQMALLRPITDL